MVSAGLIPDKLRELMPGALQISPTRYLDMKAVWKGVVLAESDETIVIEGNHYFPRESLRPEFFEESSHTTQCFWKGEASYFDVVVNGDRNSNAAWYYPSPSQMARGIKDRVAFWHGVEVVK